MKLLKFYIINMLFIGVLTYKPIKDFTFNPI